MRWRAGALRKALTEQLVTTAERVYPEPLVRAKVVADLKDGLKLTSFVPRPTIKDDEVNGYQDLVFFIDTTSSPNVSFEVGNDFELAKNSAGNYVPASAEPYSADRIDRSLPLSGVQQWELRSYFVNHPFHIHINSFQIVKIVDPNGKDVSVAGAVDDADPSGADPQYAGLQGVWKDTLWIKSLISSPTGLTNPPTGIYKIVIRTRYERYIGQFVLHCHILDHEDQGMMRNVSIGIPNGQGGTTHAHH
jgi:L-ascorbate oxidase